MAAAVAPASSGFDFRARTRLAAGQLDEALAEHDAQLAQWRRDRAQALQLEAQQAARELHRERAEIRDLAADVDSTAQLTEAAAKVHAEGVRSAAAMREAADAAAQRFKVAASAREQLLSAKDARLEELRCEERASREQEGSIAARAEEMSRFTGLYRDRLGLALTRAAPQAVRLAFTLLDAADLSREFAFTLSLAAPASTESAYCVEACSPALSTRTMDALLRRLNAAEPSEAAALPTFVCGMRRAFQAMALGSS